MLAKEIHILVLENNDDHAFLAKQALIRASSHVRVHTFSNGKEALEWLEHSEERPTIILLDLDMPEMDGFAFLQKFNEQFPHLAVPVLLLTSIADERNVRQAYRLGAAGYLAKPLNLPQNLRKLQNYLDVLQIPLTVWPYSHIPSSAGIVV